MCGHIIPFQGGRVPSLPFFFLAVMGIQASLHTLWLNLLSDSVESKLSTPGLENSQKEKLLKLGPVKLSSFKLKFLWKASYLSQN